MNGLSIDWLFCSLHYKAVRASSVCNLARGFREEKHFVAPVRWSENSDKFSRGRLTPFATHAYSCKDPMLLSIESFFEWFSIFSGPRWVPAEKPQNWDSINQNSTRSNYSQAQLYHGIMYRLLLVYVRLNPTSLVYWPSMARLIIYNLAEFYLKGKRHHTLMLQIVLTPSCFGWYFSVHCLLTLRSHFVTFQNSRNIAKKELVLIQTRKEWRVS